MVSSRAKPFVTKKGARIGPVFSMKDGCAFVKVSKADERRAVVNVTSMTLVEYADKSDFPEGEVCSDQSLFVPILCVDCYGTQEEDYTEVLSGIGGVGGGGDRFLVGMCCVFGVAKGEVYPEGRKEYLIGNDLSYSGACHPQPGKAVFLHKVKKDIGRVQCYWHVHSRSADKCFLYCCVKCDDNEYTNGILNHEMSMGFSLGTVGDNTNGPLTEECSLVSVPMRPGCFCTLVSGKDVAQSMIRMGFSTLKDSVLEACANIPAVNENDNGYDDPDTDVLPPAKELEALTGSEGLCSIAETLAFLRRAALESAAKSQALGDTLEAIKIQNGVLTQRLTSPNDPDTQFTVQGAKDFTKRTGVTNKLCAGINSTAHDIPVAQSCNESVGDEQNEREEEVSSKPTESYQGASPARELVSLGGIMNASQTQIDTLIKLLQQQQPQQQPQPQQQQLDTPMQQDQAASQQQLRALQAFLQLAPILQPMTMQPQSYLYNQHNLQPQQQQQQQQQPGYEVRQGFPHSTQSSSGVQSYGTLSDEQRRQIAMEYNKAESERQAAFQREHEKMLDSIKASVRDVILEQQQSSSFAQPQSNHSDTGTLHRLATDKPYKRTVRKPAKADGASEGLPNILSQLRELLHLIPSHQFHNARAEGDGNVADVCGNRNGHGGGGDDDDDDGDNAALAMDTDRDRAESSNVLPQANKQLNQHAVKQSESTSVTNKQQAGYSVPSTGICPSSHSSSLEDFISAVATKL